MTKSDISVKVPTCLMFTADTVPAAVPGRGREGDAAGHVIGREVGHDAGQGVGQGHRSEGRGRRTTERGTGGRGVTVMRGSARRARQNCHLIQYQEM